jgi:hypothetical protein
MIAAIDQAQRTPRPRLRRRRTLLVAAVADLTLERRALVLDVAQALQELGRLAAGSGGDRRWRQLGGGRSLPPASAMRVSPPASEGTISTGINGTQGTTPRSNPDRVSL